MIQSRFPGEIWVERLGITSWKEAWVRICLYLANRLFSKAEKMFGKKPKCLDTGSAIKLPWHLPLILPYLQTIQPLIAVKCSLKNYYAKFSSTRVRLGKFRGPTAAARGEKRAKQWKESFCFAIIKIYNFSNEPRLEMLRCSHPHCSELNGFKFVFVRSMCAFIYRL